LTLLLAVAVVAETADKPAETPQAIQIVAWGADWCPACKANKPTLERLNKTPRYDILFVDYDKHKAFAKKYGIKSLPSYFVVEKGKVVFKTTKLQELLAYNPEKKHESTRNPNLRRNRQHRLRR